MKHPNPLLSVLLICSFMLAGCAATGSTPAGSEESAPAANSTAEPAPAPAPKSAAEPECD